MILYILLHDTAESEKLTTMNVPSWFNWVTAHKGDDETTFEACQRSSGGPHPDEVVGILSDEAAERMLERIDAKGDSTEQKKRKLRDAFDDSTAVGVRTEPFRALIFRRLARIPTHARAR